MSIVKNYNVKDSIDDILDNINDAFFITDKRLHIKAYNNKLRDLFSNSREDLRGVKIFEALGFRKSRIQAINKGLQAEGNWRGTFDLMQSENSGLSCDLYVSLLTNGSSDNKYWGIIKFNKIRYQPDVDYLALVSDQISDAVISTDLNFTIKSWNKGAEILYEYAEQEVLGKSLLEITKSSVTKRERQKALNELYRTGIWNGEVIHKNRLGKPIYCLITSSLLRNTTGEIIGHVSSVKDITDRKVLEKELRLLSNQLAKQVQIKTNELNHIFERISDAFIALDTEWNYTYVNKRAEKILKKSASELINKNIRDQFGFNKGNKLFDAFRQAFDKQKYIQLELYHEAAGKWIEHHIYPSPDGLSVFFVDITNRKQAEDLIKRQNERFKLIATATNDAIWEWDLINNKIWWSESHFYLFGFDPNKPIPGQKEWLEKIHPDDRAGLLNLVELIHEKKITNWNGEIRYLRNNSEFGILYQRGFVLYEQGKPVRLMGSFMDITERKRTMDSLIESEKRYRDLIESSTELIQSIGTSGEFLFVNGEWEKKLGYTSEDLKKIKVFDIISEECMVTCRKAFSDTLQGKNVRDLQVEFIKKDGSKIFLEGNASPRMLDGKVIGTVGFFNDITVRRNAELKILAEKELSDSIINSLPGIFYLYDIDGTFLRWNRNFEMVAGYTSDEMSGKHPLDFFHENEKVLLKEKIDNVFKDGMDEVEANLQTRNKELIPYFFTGISVNYENKLCLMGVGIDISKRKRAEEETKRANIELRNLSSHLQKIREEERTRMAREIHDQLGQQLTGLKIDISWLNKRNELSVRERSNMIKAILKILDDTINTVRKISTELRPSILDDLGLVEAIDWYSQECQKRSGIKFHVLSSFDEVFLKDDYAINIFRIYQEATTNILRHSNATEVWTEIICESDCIILRVNDNGIGFDTENVRKKNTLGLLGMKERSYMMDARYHLFSRMGEGTRIEVYIPYKR